MGSGGEFAMLDGIDARSRLIRSSIKEAVAELGYIVVLATPIALTQGPLGFTIAQLKTIRPCC